MEIEGPLPCSHESATGLDPQPNKFSLTPSQPIPL